MATKTIVESYSIPVQRGHYEERKTEAGGTSRTWVPDHPTLNHVRVSVNLEKIAAILGTKAAKSKTGKARALGGLIVVEDMSRRS